MKAIATNKAPQAKGTYSQGIETNGVIYTAGQIGLDPATGELVQGAMAQVRQVFENIRQVCIAGGGNLSSIAKLTVYLTDLADWPLVNEAMAELFSEPYPARTAIGVAALPFGAVVEMEAIVVAG
jgi:reactive intermediate/imine deaminase